MGKFAFSYSPHYFFIPISFQSQLLSDVGSDKFDIKRNNLKWKKFKSEKQYEKEIIWEKIENNKHSFSKKELSMNVEADTTGPWEALFAIKLNGKPEFSKEKLS